MVCHNGYENLELRPKIATEVGKLPISLNFTDNIIQLSSQTRSHSLLKYYLGNKFSIPISGTTDNSLFTVFSFIQRN